MKVVIVGQGYVGLPLAQSAVKAGHLVVGIDQNTDRVITLNAGISVVDDLSNSDITAMVASGYRASSDSTEYRDADVIIICVPTPLLEGKAPDLTAIRATIAEISAQASPGVLVVLESTTYPGTTATEITPALEQAGFVVGETAFVAFSPERIDPGNPTYGIRNTPKVVGADDAASLRRASAFYATVVDQVVEVSGTAEAELTKLLENTYRHINIGLVNELAVVCNELNIDVWEVVKAAATKPFGFQAFYPGPGVGGHCIPIDPNYLSHRVRQVLGRPFRFVELAEDINSSMPSYVVTRAQDLLNQQKKPLNGSSILLLGVTYKSGISDTRVSPATAIAQFLTAKGAEVSYFDPFVSSWSPGSDDPVQECVADLAAAAMKVDLVILLQVIPGLDHDEIADAAQLFLDTRGITTTESAERL